MDIGFEREGTPRSPGFTRTERFLFVVVVALIITRDHSRDRHHQSIFSSCVVQREATVRQADGCKRFRKWQHLASLTSGPQLVLHVSPSAECRLFR